MVAVWPVKRTLFITVRWGFSLVLFSFGEGPSEAEDPLPTSLKRHIAGVLLRISMLGRH